MKPLLDLARAAADVDGVEPFNEATRIALREGDDAVVLETFELDGLVVAGAVAFGDAPAELVVHPSFRRQGLGAGLWKHVAKAGVAQAWAHGDLPGARALAATVRLRSVRTLLVLRLALGDEAPQESAPEGVTLRTFTDADADAVVAVNGRAFADHPEQGAMDRADFDRRAAESWFDPAGLFVAERDGEVVGFHWTKVETAADGERVGEVYVVGVDPSAHGGGLGTALTARGLRHLHESGIRTVDLYVEGDNARALAVYRRLGFGEHARDVLYAR